MVWVWFCFDTGFQIKVNHLRLQPLFWKWSRPGSNEDAIKIEPVFFSFTLEQWIWQMWFWNHLHYINLTLIFTSPLSEETSISFSETVISISLSSFSSNPLNPHRWTKPHPQWLPTGSVRSLRTSTSPWHSHRWTLEDEGECISVHFQYCNSRYWCHFQAPPRICHDDNWLASGYIGAWRSCRHLRVSQRHKFLTNCEVLWPNGTLLV